MPKEYIRYFDMMISLAENANKEFTYMENRRLHVGSSSVGELVRTSNSKQYKWNPINNYNNERKKCLVTTSEKQQNGKAIRTFWIDINHGQEKLVIVAEKLQSFWQYDKL